MSLSELTLDENKPWLNSRVNVNSVDSNITIYPHSAPTGASGKSLIYMDSVTNNLCAKVNNDNQQVISTGTYNTITINSNTALTNSQSGSIIKCVPILGSNVTVTLPQNPNEGCNYKFYNTQNSSTLGDFIITRELTTNYPLYGIKAQPTTNIVGISSGTQIKFTNASTYGDLIQVTFLNQHWAVFAYAETNGGIANS